MPRYRDYDGPFYPQSVPIPVEGGIVARTGRGKKFGTTWWASRWIAVLESFGWDSRLQRGRRYARAGQVLSIDLAPGHVRARVQGSRPRPYTVKIDIEPLSDRAWERVIEGLSERALYAARLLAGEMPQDIEEAFSAAGASLFPTSARDIRTNCSCPDWANPCKHIAAVYYLLGEAFDQDPFVIFRLRGRTQEEITAALRARRAAGGEGQPTPTVAEEQAADREGEGEPLPASPDSYWSPGESLDDLHFAIAPPEVPLALLRRLGEPPFWPEGPSLAATLRPVYQAVTQAALDVAFGEDESRQEDVHRREDRPKPRPSGCSSGGRPRPRPSG